MLFSASVDRVTTIDISHLGDRLCLDFGTVTSKLTLHVIPSVCQLPRAKKKYGVGDSSVHGHQSTIMSGGPALLLLGSRKSFKMHLSWYAIYSI